MPNQPPFNYFLSNIKNQVQKNSNLWKSSIPVSRKQPKGSSGIHFCHGDYFTAAQSFLSANDCHIILSAVSQISNQSLKLSDISRVNIFQEKHGEFYHPARIETIVGRNKFSFVLNVAVSATGRRCIAREYELLRKLGRKFQHSYIPDVYGKDEICLDNNLNVSMFLGQWFEGYNEFHLSPGPTGSGKRIRVWDPANSGIFLSKNQTRTLYRRAAMILTLYYDLETFNQIFPWHHAAGDFVIKIKPDGMDLKLITVRQYAPLFDTHHITDGKYKDLKFIIDGMLVFFLNLSIRMRLDRLDGVGDIVWSDDCAVEETLKGFYQALTLKPQSRLIPSPQADFFLDYLSALPESQLYDLSLSIANAYNPAAPEVTVIKDRLKPHVANLYHSIKVRDRGVSY